MAAPKCKVCGGRQGAPTNPSFSAGAYRAGFKTYGKINDEGLCRPCAAGKAELEAQMATPGGPTDPYLMSAHMSDDHQRHAVWHEGESIKAAGVRHRREHEIWHQTEDWDHSH